ncbi:MAG: transcriptional regulator [Actinomycetota bacterium]|nr:transcriptional regulator [Actinomycetota bacterium]
MDQLTAHRESAVVESQSEEEAGGIGALVELRLLPAFGLYCGGEMVMLSRGLQRLLAFLAVADRAVDRARLAGVLWSDTSESRATANLRGSLWRLRQTELALLEGRGNMLGLHPAVHIDLRCARTHAERLLGRHGGPRPDDLAPRALTNDLLEDWYDDWLLMERERFRQVRLHALEALCDQLVQSGRHPEAIEAGLGAVAGEPFRDSAQRALIRAYLAEGNVSEAERQYRSYQALLSRSHMAGPAFSLADIDQGVLRDRPRDQAGVPG